MLMLVFALCRASAAADTPMPMRQQDRRRLARRRITSREVRL
jgi:hypothetical protein